MKKILITTIIGSTFLSLMVTSARAGAVWGGGAGDLMWNTLGNWSADPNNNTDIFNSASTDPLIYINADASAARVRQNVGSPARTLTIASTNLSDATLSISGSAAEIFDNNGATADFTLDGTANGNGASLKLAIGGNKPTPVNTDTTLNLLLDISGSGNLNLTAGSDGAGTNGTINLGGINTYSGNTTVVAEHTINLLDNAQLTFYIGANGVNNGISGAGNVNLDGDFLFDLSGAGIAPGNSWNIVDVANLNETFGATFQVIGGFTESVSGVWTMGDWTFTEATGLLTVVPEPSTVVLGLLGGLGLLMVVRRRRSA